VGGFVVDFYSPELKLAIELDGHHHDTPAQSAHDAARTRHLLARGIRLVRIQNSELSEPTLRALIHPFVPPLRVCGEGDRG